MEANLSVKYNLLKIQHEQDIRRVSIPQEELSYAGLVRTIKSIFKEIPSGNWFNLHLKYIDSDGELVTITNNDVCCSRIFRLLTL
jgi:hypothetical protein